MIPFLQAAAAAALTLGTGAAAVSVLNADIPDMAVPQADWTSGHELDGMRFAIEAVLDNDRVETDELVFFDGEFQSTDCQRYCDFGFSEYRTWTKGATVHFTATTRCRTAPHTVVWHGRVTDGAIEVEMSWTTRRWYWTHQITGTGDGTLMPAPAADATG